MSATDHPAPIAEPSPAELARCVLAAARSLTLTTAGRRVELVGLHSPETPDRLLLNVQAECHVGGEVAATPYGDLPATVEFTDVAPVAVRDRVRVHVLLGGWLSLDRPGVLCFETAGAELAYEGHMTDVVLTSSPTWPTPMGTPSNCCHSWWSPAC